MTGVDTSRGPERLHLSLITPGSAALPLLTGDDRVDVDDLDWDFPDGCVPGEMILHVAGGDQPAVVGWDLLIEGPQNEDGLDLDPVELFPSGVSLLAVERRLGHPLPALPGTVASPRAGEVLDAVAAEAASPTPWRKLEPEACRTPRNPEGHLLEYGCPLCEADGVPLETHILVRRVPEEHATSIEVCESCHDLLHAPLPAALDDLIGRNRPPCPCCSAMRTHRIIWGMPVLPILPGYTVAGCAPPAVPEEFACPDCGQWWTEEDSYFPRIPDAGPDERVRARLAASARVGGGAHPALLTAGRLVMGRLLFPGKDAPTPAWDGPASVCDLIGDDGRIYTAELESVRALNPGMDFPGAPGWEDTPTGPEETAVIVDEMGSELYEALDADPGQVTLASPFLSYAVAKELAARAADSEYYWYLLTRLDAHAAAGGYLSIAGLGLLLDAGVEIRNCTGLHAKAFVVGRRFAMVGSGNLTNAGLGFAQPSNRELAVRLPRSEVRRVQRILDEWWDEGSDVGADKLTALQKQVDSLPRPPRGSHTPGELSNQDLAAVVEQILGDARDTDAGLWIKAVDGTPVPRDWDPDGWFSSHSGNRPGFAPGDLVLLYSKEQGGCVGVLEVLDEPAHDPEFVSEQIGVESGQRWPWVNTARPRLMPLADVVVSGDEMGVKRHGLQGGRMHIGLTEFAGVVRALAAGCEAASPGDRVSFLG